MTAKEKLKQLAVGKLPLSSIINTDGVYYREKTKEVITATKNLLIYRPVKKEDDIEKITPFFVFEKFNKLNTLLFIPDNGRG